MNTKRIEFSDVVNAYRRNVQTHDEAVVAMAAAGIAEGPMPIPFDPEKPFAIQIREPREGDGPNDNWCLHKWRFRTIQGAMRALADLKRLDGRLEGRIATVKGASPDCP